nr:pre-mRNA splicing Prp18-interacting factor [Tanacetum cinerariifolium]
MSSFVLCVGCGEPLYDFSPCRWCTCERCGINLRNGFCLLCNSRNSCVYDPNPNSFDCPPDSYHPPHPTYKTYSYDSYGNDSQFGYDCQPQLPFNYESEQGCNKNCTSYPYDSSSLPQQYLCCENCGGPHETFQCQPTNEDCCYEQNSCYNSNSFGSDHCQPPQYTVDHPIFDAQNKIVKQMTQLTSMCELACQIFQKKQEEKRIEEEQAANARYWKIPACCDDDDDDDSAITPFET